MRQGNERVTELGGLLAALHSGGFGSNKYAAEVRVRRASRECSVIEYFDDGKGHSGAFSSTITPVDASVFEEALRLGYVTGKLEPGYVSTTEFVLTRDEFLLERIYPLARDWREKEWDKRYSTICGAPKG